MTVIVRLALRHCLPFTHKDYFKLTDTHVLMNLLKIYGMQSKYIVVLLH